MKEDTHTRTEADAAHVARDLGRNQAISDHHEPVTTPYCQSCQGGTKAYVCGPCQRSCHQGHDRSAGRWCESCGQHGSHHSDRHGEFVCCMPPELDAR